MGGYPVTSDSSRWLLFGPFVVPKTKNSLAIVAASYVTGLVVRLMPTNVSLEFIQIIDASIVAE
jgi:hypothetical protein